MGVALRHRQDLAVLPYQGLNYSIGAALLYCGYGAKAKIKPDGAAETRMVALKHERKKERIETKHYKIAFFVSFSPA